jgi:hypothetical protein
VVEKRFSVLDPAAEEPYDVVLKPEFWRSVCARKRRDKEGNKKLAAFLAGLICLDDSAPYVARGILRNGRVTDTDTQAAIIVDRLSKAKLDPTACPGVAGFTAADWKAVDRLKLIPGHLFSGTP